MTRRPIYLVQVWHEGGGEVVRKLIIGVFLVCSLNNRVQVWRIKWVADRQMKERWIDFSYSFSSFLLPFLLIHSFSSFLLPFLLIHSFSYFLYPFLLIHSFSSYILPFLLIHSFSSFLLPFLLIHSFSSFLLPFLLIHSFSSFLLPFLLIHSFSSFLLPFLLIHSFSSFLTSYSSLIILPFFLFILFHTSFLFIHSFSSFLCSYSSFLILPFSFPYCLICLFIFKFTGPLSLYLCNNLRKILLFSILKRDLLGQFSSLFLLHSFVFYFTEKPQ